MKRILYTIGGILLLLIGIYLIATPNIKRQGGSLFSSSAKKSADSLEAAAYREKVATKVQSMVDSMSNQYCNETLIKARFMEWMDSYYPDYRILGKIKLFRTDGDKTDFYGTQRCVYGIRFQVLNPHISAKEIIVVQHEYDESSNTFKISPIRGILY